MKNQSIWKIVIFLVIVAGLSAVTLSLLKIEWSGLDASFALLAIGSLLLGVGVGLRVPGAREYVPLYYLFVFAALLFFDHNAVIVVTGLAAFYASGRRRKSLPLVLFNAASAALAVSVIYHALHFYFESSANITRSYNLLIAICFIAVAQSAFHSIFVSVTEGYKPSGGPLGFSKGDFLRRCLTYFLLAAAAGFTVKLSVAFNLSGLTAAAFLFSAAFASYLIILFGKERVAAPRVAEARVVEPPVAEPKVAEAPVALNRPSAQMNRAEEDVFRSAFECASIPATLVTAKGQCLQVNRSLCELLDYSAEELQSSSFQRFVHPDDVGKVQAFLTQLLKDGTGAGQVEKRFLKKGGGEVWTRCDISSVRGKQTDDQYLLFQVQDITGRKEAEEALLHNAFHDALTGLPNRVLFVDHLQLAINRTQRHEGQIYAVLFIDLDRFKIINDSLGHFIGDQLLINIARTLETCLRPGDSIARVGGDEFTVLLEDLADESEAVSIAHRIQKELSSPFILEGREVFTTVSIGVAPSSPGYSDPADILRDADTAMYRAKLMGKNRYEIFDKAMHEVAVDLLQMETDLRHALERGEFFIQYQPIVSLDNFRLRGFEALVRWRHAERGLVSPLDFIPVAEDTGQIIAIGEWVLRESCKQMHRWQRQYGMEQPLFVSVNLSGKQFAQPDLVEQVKAIITETRLNPRGLKLEITESMVMENIEAATGMLHQLRDLGVQLSIDDFGTGYSSLSYLHRFPIDTLKIDRSFVIKMIDNNENVEIVRTIIMLAQNLGMDVIAEGVETKEQLAMLRKLKCENGQGYYFSRPLETGDAENLLSDVCTEGNPFKKAKQSKPEPVMNTRVKSIKLAPATDLL